MSFDITGNQAPQTASVCQLSKMPFKGGIYSPRHQAQTTSADSPQTVLLTSNTVTRIALASNKRGSFCHKTFTNCLACCTYLQVRRVLHCQPSASYHTSPAGPPGCRSFLTVRQKLLRRKTAAAIASKAPSAQATRAQLLRVMCPGADRARRSCGSQQPHAHLTARVLVYLQHLMHTTDTLYAQAWERSELTLASNWVDYPCPPGPPCNSSLQSL